MRVYSSPGVVLPEPPVQVVELADAGDGWLRATPTPTRLHLPESVIVHEVADADVEDPHSVLAFAQALHGCVVPLHRGPARWGDIWESRAGDGWAGYTRTVAGSAARMGLPAPTLGQLRDRGPVSAPEEVHLGEVAARLVFLQALRRHVLELPGDDVAGGAGYIHLQLANKALAAFGPLLIAAGDPERGSPMRNVTAFTVAILQLVNESAAGTPAKVCQSCGRPYFVQRNRRSRYELTPNDKRSHRSIYCSERCVNRVRTRNYRQRQQDRLSDAG